ncbi:hypothetical protein GN244_ATG08476 [Phytophthora infestans]|uniref:DUF6818 domain-containing protein n=1 Tax=Phytophthora infestans TaxID=4787 RepID=A0A833SVA8_PHYIN|nr:hypothetical protein GN244_ATG08476 [Phytophthora infestans]
MAKGKTKGKNFTTSEVMRLLDIVEDILPFGAEQWQNVASLFNTNIPAGWTERDRESLKRKYQKLVRVPKPTGNGACPAEVQRAKRLQYAIEASIAVVDIHDDTETTDDGGLSRALQLDHQDELQWVDSTNAPSTDEDVSTTVATSFSDSFISSTSMQSPQTNVTQSAASTPLQATARAGLEPSELAELSKTLGKRRASSTDTVSLSQTARRRIEIDQLIDNAESSIRSEESATSHMNNVVAMFMAMKERHEARDAQYWQERERYQRQRDERESANQQMMMMLMT